MAQDKSNDEVQINHDNAVLLLAAAEELGLDAAVVETTSEGTFRVPQDVVDKAGLGKKAKADKKAEPEKKAPAKRAAAKKAAPAKKAAAKKAAATEQTE